MKKTCVLFLLALLPLTVCAVDAVEIDGVWYNLNAEKGCATVVSSQTRHGYEGERIYAPDVTDEKLQTWKACAEIGRKVLCETGFWVRHTLKMYSLAAPSGTPGYRPNEPELPGLCWPGDFVQVQERSGRNDARVWFGDVEAVQIDVAINNNAVYVAQTLGINEYTDKHSIK